jgi:hypothetical protein
MKRSELFLPKSRRFWEEINTCLDGRKSAEKVAGSASFGAKSCRFGSIDFPFKMR